MYQKDLNLNNFFFQKNTLLNSCNNKYNRLQYNNIRFSYHIELYCLEYYNYLLLLNIFFLTNLNFFKISKKKKYDNNKLNYFF